MGETSPNHPGKVFYRYTGSRQNFNEVWLEPDAIERLRLLSQASRDTPVGKA